MEIYTKGILGDGLRAAFRNPMDCLVPTHSDNSGHTATLVLRPNYPSVSFVCPKVVDGLPGALPMPNEEVRTDKCAEQHLTTQ